MSLSACGLAVFACVAVLVLQSAFDSTDALPTTDLLLQSSTPLSLSSRDVEDEVQDTSALATTLTDVVVGDSALKDLALVDSEKGHVHKPIKKKKPLGKHKKKKNSFKDKFLPLLLIPFVIQTMLIPFFIMKLKLLALKAMAVGKFAILLIVFNMMRNWSQNAHSTSIRGSTGDSLLMAQNYGFNGVPEFGAIFNGR
ncbi:uncharacterized protein LOC132934303 isoform X1 [Metopolophium dirhodum]|uniref:uncharacterized protein LOC132934303 isoform X1 n=1 Tax=Metopolophium dirhodum TaxID=44670 RepID=UPI0029906A38|nr:uncharacterized protein LOC132934303 isoform X1 [Metopolophium dirhodum]